MRHDYCPYCMSSVGEDGLCPTCGPDAGSHAPQPHHLPPGTTLHDGRYLVGRALGSGGFGITYIGRDLKLGIKVAIKEFFPDGRATRNASGSGSNTVSCLPGTTPEAFATGRRKFRKEAQILAQLEKLQVVVGVRDVFEENNTAYLVMEYVEGVTMARLAEQRGGRIEPDELFRIVKPLFPALSELHDAGLLHRDISPDNLMLERGHIRLVDFGCAREGTGERLTAELKGGYTPIEQYEGLGYGPWSDIYSLCATLYRCLTGVTPPHALERAAADELKPPSECDGVNLPESQERALLRGLNVRPRRRFRSIRKLEIAIYGTSPDERGDDETNLDIQERHVWESPERLSLRLLWRRRATRIVFALTLVAASAMAAIAIWHARPWTPSSDTQEVAEAEDSPQLARDPSAYEAYLSEDLDAQFDNAREIRSYDELEKAKQAGVPVIIAADTEVGHEFIDVPVLIPQGITFQGPSNAHNSEGEDEAPFTFTKLVVNRGTLRGDVTLSDEGILVNHGTVGSEDDLDNDSRITCRGTIVNEGSLFAASGSSLCKQGTLYNVGYAMVSDLYVQDSADLYNRGELRVCGRDDGLVHTSGKPLFNEVGATLSVAPLASLNQSAYLCNWGTFQAESQSILGAPIIQNEGQVVADYGVAEEDECIVFGHGTTEALHLAKRSYDLSGAEDADATVPTIDTVGGTIAQVATAEELLTALASDDVAGIALVADVEVDRDLKVSKPLALGEGARLEMIRDAKLTIAGCELRLNGEEHALETNDIKLRDGACLWGAGLDLGYGSTLTATGSLVNLHDPLAEACANTSITSCTIILDDGSTMLWSFPDANSCDVQVRGGSALAMMGTSSLSNDTKLAVDDGSLFMRGDTKADDATVTIDAYSRWYQLGGKLDAWDSTVSFGGISYVQDCDLWLTYKSALIANSLCTVESFGHSASQLKVSDDSSVTNDNALCLLTKKELSLEGSLVNIGELYVRKGAIADDELDHVTGNGDIVII